MNEITKQNDSGIAPASQSANAGGMQIATSKSAAEVKAAMVLAKEFPRNEADAFSRINRACKRKGLADAAFYAYPRGDEIVTGPSIRLAEELARCWGNVDFGIIELEQNAGASSVMAYCWDLENNVRETKVFTVPHVRATKRGAYRLTDPRDIYETIANAGARRLRACILGVIPGDVQDHAVRECHKTLSGNNDEPLADRVRKMVARFADLGVTREMIESRLGHAITATSEDEVIKLRAVFASIKDGATPASQWFDLPESASGESKSKQVAEELKSKSGKPKRVKPAKDAPEDVPEEKRIESEDSLGFGALMSAARNAETVDDLNGVFDDARELFELGGINKKQMSEIESALNDRNQEIASKKD